MSDISYYTEEGYKALKDEVHHLVSVERPKISAHARKISGYYDGEIQEYTELLNFPNKAKIAKMENLLANARIIDDSKIDNSKVYILSIVKFETIKMALKLPTHWSLKTKQI